VFTIFDKSKNGVYREIVELNRKRYLVAKGSVKPSIFRVQKAVIKFSEKLDGEDKKGKCLECLYRW